MQLATLVALAGFALAAVFGWVASASNFCAMGAVSDAVNMGDWGRMRMWMLAVAVALIVTHAFILAGWIDLSKSLYTGERILWLSHLIGGALFGVGMTLASGCGARNLVRLGAGNLKSFVVLLCLGAGAYMTMKGVLAPIRVNYLEQVRMHSAGGQELPRLLANFIRLPYPDLRAACVVLIGMGLLTFALWDRDFRRTPASWLSGITIGIVVSLGWVVTAHLGYLPEDPNTLEEAFVGTNTRRPESFTFVAPVAYGMELMLLWTDASLRVTFGIAAVVGMILGAFAHALVMRRFRWEGFANVADLRAHLLGGLLMGFGGVTALGCTIGQGITGVSTLALGSFITLLSIILAAALTMKWLYWRLSRA